MKWITVEWCMDCCTVVQEYDQDQECNCRTSGEEE